MQRLFSIPVILGAIGIIGAFASMSAVTDPVWRVAAIVVSFSLLSLAVALRVGSCCNLGSAWRILTVCKRLGIRRIYGHGELTPKMSGRIEDARQIRMMAITGFGWIHTNETHIRNALVHSAAKIRILIAEPESDFMKNQKSAESDTRLGHGPNETSAVLDLLREDVRAAQKEVGANQTIGTVSVAYYRTDLRSSIIICDDSWGWLTINLPPSRARHMPSLELVTASGGLLADCITHFERIWTLSANTIQKIQ
ncbi:MAG TPA: hypothetical protein VMY42_09510 [Thermoguttaceae bacterium]|nr:hypothetical protein [Thermoguttaceae bacterium]